MNSNSGVDGLPPDKKIEDKRAKLLSETSQLVYPSDLNEEFYISFNAFTCSQDRPEEAKRTFSFNKSLYLPFPSSLTDQYGATYNREDLFFGGEFLKNSINGLMTSGGTKSVENLFGEGVADRAGMNAAEVLEKFGKSPSQSAAAVGTYLLSGVGGAIGAAAKTAFNVTTNPYPVMIYQGTGFKSFAFSWTFYPESPQETNTIKKIIGYFRREMLPERVENIPSILKYPAIFEVAIKPDVKKFKRCVVSNLDVNYTPSGPSFIRDSSQNSSLFQAESDPAAITMTITLQEIEIWLANDFSTSEQENFGYGAV